MTILKVILAIFLPPLSVLLNNGIGAQFLINILLTILGGLPGSIHAVYLLATGDR